MLAARPTSLARAAGENVADHIQLYRRAMLAVLREPLERRVPLTGRGELQTYLLGLLAREREERMIALFLDASLCLIAEETIAWGTVDHVGAHPREIVRRALELGATSLILVHNHPGGSAAASRDDIALTRTLVAACKPLGLHVVDHLIVARGGCTSMRDCGIV